MIFQSIIKSVPALLYSVLTLALFYWQFNMVYSFIITHFTEEKLSILYGYLFIYLFGILFIMTTLVNLLHYFLLKNKIFVTITLLTLTLFYGFSFKEFYHVIEYFINYPFSSNTIMGMIFFMLLTLGQIFYSLVLFFFRDHMPLSHIVIFFLLGGGYTLYFINQYCKPLSLI
jgi:hypothetical protein